MGKKANEKRKRIFQELREQGKLDKRIRHVPSKPIVHTMRATLQPEPVEPAEMKRFQCCITRYGDELPNGFRMCRDCPGP